MNCPKCGAEVNRSNLREDDLLICPGCNTVYRRKRHTSLPARDQVRKTAKRSSLPHFDVRQTSDETHLGFDMPAVLSAVMAALCFLRTCELAWSFLCIVGSVLLIVYTLKINTASPAFVMIPVGCILLKEIIRSTQWQGFWLTVLMIIITALIWAGDHCFLPFSNKEKSNLEMIRYLLSIVNVLVCFFFMLKRIVGAVSYSSLVILHHFGLLCIAVSLVQVFGPWEKRSGKKKGSLLGVSIGIYAAALALGTVGFVLSDTFSNAVSTYRFGKNILGGYVDYALQEFGGMSKSYFYLLLGCAVAFICEASGLILVNFRICRKDGSFLRIFVLDAVLIIVSLLIVLIGTQLYLAAGIVGLTLIVTAGILTRYFNSSSTVQEYFDYD